MPSLGMSVGASIRPVLRMAGALRWYLQELMGETSYRRYLDHHLAHQVLEHPMLSQR